MNVCLFFLLPLVAAQLYEGDHCTKDARLGACRHILKCKSAVEELRQNAKPMICSFLGTIPIVCCFDEAISPKVTSSPATEVTTHKPRVTTKRTKPIKHNQWNENDDKRCTPLPSSITSKTTGQKSWDKCIEYQEKLVYPCERSVALLGGFSRANKCKHKADPLIYGGEDASLGEYPHMVLLGYGPIPDWLCGGSLISERFILTAGHCTVNKRKEPVSLAIVGALKRSDTISNERLYRISRSITPDSYNYPVRYNDIALLETERAVQLNEFVVPACLHVGNQIDDEKASATGWGFVSPGEPADQLQKVTLLKFNLDECQKKYEPSLTLRNGIESATQLCYGDKVVPKDTCEMDSGGPLQIKNKDMDCMWTIIGVTSFGRSCGIVGQPGVYTKVSKYLPWIESIVWP